MGHWRTHPSVHSRSIHTNSHVFGDVLGGHSGRKKWNEWHP